MVKEGVKVFVYRNLHKNLYSVRGPEGRVLIHTDNLILKDVKYCVGQKGRERVIRTKQKNVHAGVRGFVHTFVHTPNFDYVTSCSDRSRVIYNPYLYSSFVLEHNKSPIYESKYAILKYEDDKPTIYALI